MRIGKGWIKIKTVKKILVWTLICFLILTDNGMLAIAAEAESSETEITETTVGKTADMEKLETADTKDIETTDTENSEAADAKNAEASDMENPEIGDAKATEDWNFYWNGSGKNITSDEAVLADKTSIEGEISYISVDGMSTSQNGIELIKEFEGCILTAYKGASTEKYYTIGYGHYGADVYEGMTITQEEAEALLVKDLVVYEGYVNTFLQKNSIIINQNQFDALVSFTYNLGNVWVSYSTFQLKTYLINGISDYTDEQITTAFTNWNKSGGVAIAGLTRRRNAEAVLFLTPVAESELEIITQPKDYTGEIGTAAKFTVAAKGTDLTYQWQYLNPGTTIWKNSGQTGNKTKSLSVSITAARDGQKYRCIITDGTGKSIISDSAAICAKEPAVYITITSQPVDYTGVAGSTASFAVIAKGEDLTYQWQYLNADALTWRNSGQTGNKTASLNVSITAARDGQKYRCVITDSNGHRVVSDAATLHVSEMGIISQPVNYTGKVGSIASFSVKAKGEGLTYQWQYLNKGTTIWKNSSQSGNKTANLNVQITAARDGQKYRCIITDINGDKVISEAATLIVD